MSHPNCPPTQKRAWPGVSIASRKDPKHEHQQKQGYPCPLQLCDISNDVVQLPSPTVKSACPTPTTHSPKCTLGQGFCVASPRDPTHEHQQTQGYPCPWHLCDISNNVLQLPSSPTMKFACPTPTAHPPKRTPGQGFRVASSWDPKHEHRQNRAVHAHGIL